MRKSIKDEIKTLNKCLVGIRNIKDIKHNNKSRYIMIRRLVYRMMYYDYSLKDLLVDKYDRKKVYKKMRSRLIEMVTYGVIDFDEYTEHSIVLYILKKQIDKFYFIVKFL